jgi:hypothetical protein
MPLMGQWLKGFGSRSILPGRAEELEGGKRLRGIVEWQGLRQAI